MRGTNQGRLVLLVAVVAAFLAAMAHVQYAESLQETLPVYVVQADVPAFSLIKDEQVRMHRLPADAVPADAITDQALIVGRYARTLLVKDTVVRPQHLMERSGGSLAARLTQNQQQKQQQQSQKPASRAMALPVNPATGVAGTLEPGDKVDVLVAIKVEEEDAEVTYAKIIARDVPVLHSTVRDGNAANGTVVLEVPPDRAEDIAFAQTAGSIWLLTRPYQTEDPETKGVSLETFLEKYGIPAGNRSKAQAATERGR